MPRKTVVLSGYSGESFAAGADIGQMVHFSPGDAFHFAELGQSLFDQTESCPKSIIGALNGITMGGGWSGRRQPIQTHEKSS